MKFEWLEAFRTVIDRQGYSRAAEQLGLTQPAVSQRIRQLEQYFDAELLMYAGRALCVTAAGASVYRLACDIELQIAEARQRVDETTLRAQKLVTIASGPAALTHFLPGVLQRFWQAHPDTSVRTITKSPSEISESVLRGKADVGIVPGSFVDPRLRAEPCSEPRTVAVCPPHHPLANLPSITAYDLQDQRLAVLTPDTEGRRTFDEWFTRQGCALRNYIELSTLDEIRAATLMNSVIGIVTHGMVADDIQLGTLQELPVQDLKIDRTIYAVTRRRASPAAVALLNTITSISRTPAAAGRG